MRVTLTQPRNEMSLVGCKGIQGAWAGVPMHCLRIGRPSTSNFAKIDDFYVVSESM